MPSFAKGGYPGNRDVARAFSADMSNPVLDGDKIERGQRDRDQKVRRNKRLKLQQELPDGTVLARGLKAYLRLKCANCGAEVMRSMKTARAVCFDCKTKRAKKTFQAHKARKRYPQMDGDKGVREST